VGIDSHIVDSNGRPIRTADEFGLGPALVTTRELFGRIQFKSIDVASATTTTITSPDPDGYLVVFDIVVGSRKSNAASVIVEFDDGTDTVKIADFEITAVLNASLHFVGRVAGWKDGALKVVTSSAAAATIFATYIKIPSGIPFAEWDALR